MSGLPLVVDRDDREDSRRGQLLALPRLRRSMERRSFPDACGASARRSLAMMRNGLVRDLQELIEALDRRVPHAERPGEASIARDAAALKAQALKRLEELEGGSG
jgi:hypothetical protein